MLSCALLCDKIGRIHKAFLFHSEVYFCHKEKNHNTIQKMPAADETVKEIISLTKAKRRAAFITLPLDVTDSLHSFWRKRLSNTEA